MADTESTAKTDKSFAADALKGYIDRLERLEEEKSNIGEDIKEVFSEAKATGFDTKTMKSMLKIRGMENSDLVEQAELLRVYGDALGMDLSFLVI